MDISRISSNPAVTAPVSLPRENEAVERKADSEAKEVSSRISLKEGLGTQIDVSA